MKMNFKAISTYTCAAITGVIAMTACTSNPDSPGLEYMPDMYRSPAVETYVDYGRVKGKENEDWKVKQTAMTPPNSTVPYYGTDEKQVELMLPYHRKPSSIADVSHGLYDWELSDSLDAEYNAAAADKNPLMISSVEERDAMFAKGKKIYESKCAHCHGKKGDGQGPMVVSGAYAGVPAYNTLDIAEGQMFYSIYYGKGAMGAHASIVNKEQIWTLVHYVNKFKNPDYLKDIKAGGAIEASAPLTEETDLTTVNVDESHGKTLRLGLILFKVDSDEIEMDKSVGLKPLLDFMLSNAAEVELAGYTDTDGDDAHNLELSQERAAAVKTYLVNNGVDANRIDAIGHGEENPIIIEGVEAKELSRRTELKIK